MRSKAKTSATRSRPCSATNRTGSLCQIDSRPSIRQLLRQCLDKEPTRRLGDMNVARLQIEEALREPRPMCTRIDARIARADDVRHPIPLALILAVALVASAAGAVVTRPDHRARSTADPPEQRLASREHSSCRPGRPAAGQRRRREPDRRTTESHGHGAVARRALARVQRRARRHAAAVPPRPRSARSCPNPGTEGGASPFFSPDGRWVGFQADDALKKVPLTMGTGAVTICRTRRMVGATWGSNNTIVFARH